jgi:hypothetical protein
MAALAKNSTVLPVRGQSVSELYASFARSRELMSRAKPDAQAHSTCALFANRLLRAPPADVGDVLLKVEAAEWLGQDPRQTLTILRGDLFVLWGGQRC